MKRKTNPRIVVEKVPSDKSKIKFVAVFEGEMDWNELFGMEKETDGSFCHDCHEFRYSDKEFKQNLINYIFRTASHDDDYKIFQTAKLTNLEISEEAINAYKQFKEKIENKEKAEKLDKLKDAEKEVARLRSEVLKEFKTNV